MPGRLLFIYTYDGATVLLPPAPDKEGSNRWTLTDADGFLLVQGLIQTVRQGGANVSCRYPRAGGSEALPKLGYAKVTYFPADALSQAPGCRLGIRLPVTQMGHHFVANATEEMIEPACGPGTKPHAVAGYRDSRFVARSASSPPTYRGIAGSPLRRRRPAATA